MRSAVWAVVGSVALAGIAWAAEPAAPADPARKQVEAAIEAYVKAFNTHDAAALAALWSSSGVHVDPATGERTEGRAAIEKLFAAQFAEGGGTLEVSISDVHFTTPAVAVVDGAARVTLPDAPPMDSSFSAVLVREGEAWLVDSVRESDLPPPPEATDPLAALEWLVGSWSDESDDVAITTVCRWSPNRAFLIRAYSVTRGEELTHQGTQIIGWDPERQQIRCWVFASDGGFADGVWSTDGQRWNVQLRGVTPEGHVATATQILTPQGPDAYLTQMVSAELNGEPRPNQDPVRVVRLRPQP